MDQRCRESEGKAKIEGYMSVSDEEAHHRFFMSCCASLCAASASFRDVSRFLRCSSNAGRWAVSMIVGIACGSYPSMR